MNAERSPAANGHLWPCAGFYTGNHEPPRAGAWACTCYLPLAREIATGLRGDTPEHQARLREIDPSWEPFTERDLEYIRLFLASDWLAERLRGPRPDEPPSEDRDPS